MDISEKGLAFIQDCEKLKLMSYLDQGGVPTIGWGTTRLNKMPVTLGMVINYKVAEALFLGDITPTVQAVTVLVKVGLSQNRFDALISLCYNIGIDNFSTSTLLKSINHKLVINEDLFTRWNKVRDPKSDKLVVSAGLLRRRKAEFAMFTSDVLKGKNVSH